MATFDDIKHLDNDGAEYWFARELQTVLQYAKWENFHKVIKQAMLSCHISKQNVEDCFPEVRRSIISGKGRTDNIIDYRLTRYACYLIVMNGDPRKEIIALGQTYFAVKTRQQELQELYNLLTENERRLFLRGDIKQKNMLLAKAAHDAGIRTQIEYAVFQDHGYMGLYGGETSRIIAARKGLQDGEEILDHMGSSELAANLFRITQTEEVIKNKGVATPQEANETHFTVGKAVRKTIIEIGGTVPENLPTPEKSIKEIENEERKLL